MSPRCKTRHALGQAGGQHHAGGDRLAVQPRAVAGGRLDRVAERVAEVEQRALAGLALVGGDDRGLDPAAFVDRVRERVGVARRERCGRSSSQAKNAASRIAPYLTTSASPAESSRAGKVSRQSVSMTTARGWWNAPIMFLPSGWLMPVLPPTEESTCASSVVGTCTNGMPRW